MILLKALFIGVICMNKIINHYYERHGTGIPIIFIHPPGMGHVVFKYQKPLAKMFQVILYDLRGHGKSEYKDEEVTISLLSDDLHHLLDECQIDKAIICGYSSGGSIAQEFAIRYPNRTLGLILCGGFSEVSTFLLKNEFKAGIWLAKNHLNILSNILSYSHKVMKEDEIEIKDYVLMTNQTTLVNLYRNGLKYTCTERLKLIQAPLLLIYGDKDYYIHSYQKIYKSLVTNSDTVYIDNALHQIPTKNAIPFNHAISNFVVRKFSI
jgi:pimeloyl-ACP methyl ester carboxylesterase